MRACSMFGFQRGSPNDWASNDCATSKPTSIPTRSISSNGPMRKPPPSRQMRSICSCVAARSCSSRSASAPNGRPQRLTRKPGPSEATITRLPMASPTAFAISSARSPVWVAAITSTRCISGGGLKKCIPTTFSGRPAALASELTRIEDVLVASTVSGPHTCEMRSNSSRFSSIRSGAASITSSHCDSSSSDAASTSRVSASAASSSLQRPRSAPFASPRCTRSPPRSSASGKASCRYVSSPASTPSCAIPAPIVPAPTTPSACGSSASATSDHRVLARHRAADDQLLDLRRSLVQRCHTSVAEVTLDGVVVDVAGAAVDLDREVRVADGGLGGEQLRNRRLGGTGPPGVLQPAGAPHEGTRGLGVDGHVGDHLLNELEARDRPAELLALLRVVDRRGHAALADPDAAGRDAVAARVERGHGDLEAVADVAEQRVVAHLEVVELELRGVRRPEAELAVDRGRAEALVFRGD